MDAVRIGRDAGVEWRGDSLSAQSLLRDQATRNFGNHRLWQADPDCILLRERFHSLTDVEVRSLALYAGMAGGLVMTSDKLDELSPKRRALWKLLLGPGKSQCRFPLLGQSPLSLTATGLLSSVSSTDLRALDPVLVQVRTALESDTASPVAVFILNTGDRPLQRRYPLALLGLTPGLYAYDWIAGQASGAPLDTLDVALQPHDGLLVFLSPMPFQRVPDQLP